MNNALFIIEPDGSQINCGVVRSVERVVSQERIELPEELGQVYRQYVPGLKSESFSFFLHCSDSQIRYLHARNLTTALENFKARDDLKFSGFINSISVTCDKYGGISVDLQIQVTGRVTCESIRDINKMTNFEILEFLHRRLELE